MLGTRYCADAVSRDWKVDVSVPLQNNSKQPLLPRRGKKPP